MRVGGVRVRILFFLFFLSGAPQLAAEEEIFIPKVFYSGLAYLGSFQFIEESYPQALSLNAAVEGKTGRLDELLRSKLGESPPENFRLEYGLANIYESESLVIAVAIDKETVSLERFVLQGEVKQKIIAEVSAQIIFYDFDSMSLIANYPQALAINHISAKVNDDISEEVKGLFESLYFGDDNFTGFVDRIVETIRDVSIDSVRGFRYQLRTIDLSEEVVNQLPLQLSQLRFTQYLGQFFSSQLSSSYPVQVLPFVKGYTFGNQMPGRFANGQVFNLAFPKADFVFDVEIRKLEKQKDDEKLLYGTQVTFGLYESALNREMVVDDFRYGVYKIDLGEEGLVDNWSPYEDTLENLLIELVEQLGSPERKWFSSHARNKNETYRGFYENEELFDEYLQ